MSETRKWAYQYNGEDYDIISQYESPSGEMSSYVVAHGLPIEDAERIVRAVNCLPGLVDAVRRYRDAVDPKLDIYARQEAAELDALIAEAEGGGNG